jgi:uncharacterized protein
MAFTVNGQIVEDQLIEEEIERMRPDYEALFAGKSHDEREYQLNEWARENIIERILLRQEALKDRSQISQPSIEKRYADHIESHGGEKKLLESTGLSKNDLHNEIEVQLRVDRLIERVCHGVKDPDEREKALESYLDDLRQNADIVDAVPGQFRPETRKPAASSTQVFPDSTDVRKPLNSLLIKPAGPDCNLACGYCFYLEKAALFNQTKVHRMSLDILEEMTRQAMAGGGAYMSFGWQGGEPTLMGLDFYQHAVDFQQKYGQGRIIGNGLQTNGILIDGNWAAFLKKYQFLVGLSLDGPEHVHDKYRVTRTAAGTWRKVVDSAKCMLDAGVDVNALTVLNDYSVQFPEEIYKFHKEIGLMHQQYIPCVESDPENPEKAAAFSVSADAYGQFLCTMFDLWLADFVDGEPRTSIRLFDSVFYHYVGMTPPDCTLLPECGVYVVIEHNGDVYACDFFVETKWRLGNIADDNLEELLNSDKQRAFGQVKSTLHADCRHCEWLRYCHGGCPKDRIRDSRDDRLSHFCAAYKMFYAHADDSMKALATEWRKKQQLLANRERIVQAFEKGEIKVGRNDLCPCGSGLKFKKCCGASLKD